MYFISLQVGKKVHAIWGRTQRAIVSLWQIKNSNETTKRIMLPSPLKILKKFLKYLVNAFTAKIIRVIASAICLLKNPDASIWQKAEQENCVQM